jgi:pilus assembly protein Flp/PilA
LKTPAGEHDRLPVRGEGSSLQLGGEVMIQKFFRDETGLELSEYAVAAALVAVATILGFNLLGANIATRIDTLAGFIK